MVNRLAAWPAAGSTFLIFFHLFFVLFCILLLGNEFVICASETPGSNSSSLHVGVVLDLNSPVGAMADVSIAMAVSDFYEWHPNFRTKLHLHTRDAKDVIDAASAVLSLLKNVGVVTIIGPSTTDQTSFVIEIGKKARVPIISFSATSSTLSSDHSPYFIRTAQNDSTQVKGITAIIQGFQWHEVVIIFEDTEYGNGIISYLTDAFQEVGIQVPYKKAINTFAQDSYILGELKKLKDMPTRVFLVHALAKLGSRLFNLANKAGMMSEGYAWLITDDLTSSLHEMDPVVIESMEGVIGLRPYTPQSKELEDFKIRWKRQFHLSKPNSTATELNIYGLWAYDTVWALAMAVERIGSLVEIGFIDVKHNSNATDLENLGISQIGPKLLDEMSHTKFKGLSGEFQLIGGNLQPSTFELLNVVGKGERIIGYWTPERGISRKLHSTNKLVQYSTSTKELKKIIWPGDSTNIPVSPVTPTLKKLRVGVPVKRGFTEFVKIEKGNDHKHVNATGFSIDIFLAALKKLPFELDYEFLTSPSDEEETKSYDDLLYGVYNNTFDAVVGDTTIMGHRWYVDFTLPYSDSGIAMVVPATTSKNIWIFIKPFSWDLWLTILAASILTGIVLCLLEGHTHVDPARAPTIPRKNIIETILWLPVSSLYFAERDAVVDNRSRVVLVAWYFLMMILSQSYTASLSSLLTLESLNPVITNPDQYYIGYQEGSYVKNLLINKLKLSSSKLRAYGSPEEYHEALSKGSHNGGVAAIYDETPCLKVFLAQYCSQYKIIEQTYKTDGFGFAFSINSSLTPIISKAILNVTQDNETMNELEEKYFKGNSSSCQDQAVENASKSSGLKAYNFAGLLIVTFGAVFLITAPLTLVQVVSESTLWGRLVATSDRWTHKENPPQPPVTNVPLDNPLQSPDTDAPPPDNPPQPLNAYVPQPDTTPQPPNSNVPPPDNTPQPLDADVLADGNGGAPETVIGLKKPFKFVD